MKFGDGPLQGCSITIAPDAERTIRSATLQVIRLMAAEQTQANRAKLRRLLNWAPDDDSPCLAYALAEAFTDLHTELELEQARPLEQPTPAMVEELQRRAPRSALTPSELADGFEQLGREVEEPCPTHYPPGHKHHPVDRAKDPWCLRCGKDWEHHGPEPTSDASIAPDDLARELGRPPQGALPPPAFSCATCGEAFVEGEATVIESGDDRWALERHAVCPRDREPEGPMTREQLLAREWVGERTMAEVLERSASCRASKERPKKERVTCELCVQPIEVGELSRARGKGSSRRVHESCRAEALEVCEARALAAEQADERETNPEDLHGAPPRGEGATL